MSALARLGWSSAEGGPCEQKSHGLPFSEMVSELFSHMAQDFVGQSKLLGLTKVFLDE